MGFVAACCCGYSEFPFRSSSCSRCSGADAAITPRASFSKQWVAAGGCGLCYWRTSNKVSSTAFCAVPRPHRH